MAKRYYWLKLKDDFFTDKRIKKLRRIAGGDTYTIIYLKMMMKCMNNDGILEYEGIEDSFADELALDLDEDADNVQITVNFLMQAGLLEEMGENRFLMAEVPELVGSETASAQRVRNFRNKQKTLQCNTNVTEVKQLCNVEKDKDKDKDIDININIYKNKNNNNTLGDFDEQKKEKYQDLDQFFDDLWKLYPRKRGKGSVSERQKKRLYDIGADQMTRAIERFKADNAGQEEKFIPYGSTFFNSAYVDYLDENYVSGSENAVEGTEDDDLQ